MRAIVVDRWIEPQDLEIREVPAPEPGAGQAVVEVRAAGCNFFDLLLIAGRYQLKPDFPFTPGGELAGVVVSLAADVRGLAVGDPVYAQVPMGAFAERVAVPVDALRRIPAGMSFDEAAALPIVYPTSYAALVLRARLCAGETLLVHAAAGGVGMAAVQIGKALGARVIATAGGADKLAVALDAGADVALDYRKEDWVAAVMEHTKGRGADVIYDPVGGEIFDRSLKCIAWNGRLLVIGFASGTIPKVEANRILLKNISVIGLHWSAYPSREPERVDEIFEGVAKLYETGGIRPRIFACYGMERLPDALAALGSRGTWGKLVINP